MQALVGEKLQSDYQTFVKLNPVLDLTSRVLDRDGFTHDTLDLTQRARNAFEFLEREGYKVNARGFWAANAYPVNRFTLYGLNEHPSLENWASRSRYAPYWCVQFTAEKDGQAIEGVQFTPVGFNLQEEELSSLEKAFWTLVAPITIPLSMIALPHILATYESKYSFRNHSSHFLQDSHEDGLYKHHYKSGRTLISDEPAVSDKSVEDPWKWSELLMAANPLTIPFLRFTGMDSIELQRDLSGLLDRNYKSPNRAVIEEVLSQEEGRLRGILEKGRQLDFMGRKIASAELAYHA